LAIAVQQDLLRHGGNILLSPAEERKRGREEAEKETKKEGIKGQLRESDTKRRVDLHNK
jgi:hypothetical protein